MVGKKLLPISSKMTEENMNNITEFCGFLLN